MIPVIDWHCDVLYKLEKHPEYSFLDASELDVTLTKMKQGGIKVQAFAIFVDPSVPIEAKLSSAKKQVERFRTHVLIYPDIVHIRNFRDIDLLKHDEIGVFLTLEGLDCIGDSLSHLSHFLDEGVLSVGLTWNNANLACDGIMEPRGAGLTSFGYQVITLLNERQIFADVSHISENGFNDVLNTAHHIIASHSNVRSIHDHQRNLSDDQINQMIRKGALMHLVYFSHFTTNKVPCTIDDLLEHIEAFIHFGAKAQIGLGSDFDGIDHKILNLEDSGKTQNLIRAVKNRFGEDFSEKIAFGNFMHYVRSNL